MWFRINFLLNLFSKEWKNTELFTKRKITIICKQLKLMASQFTAKKNTNKWKPMKPKLQQKWAPQFTFLLGVTLGNATVI
jgi:hypothetical protein